MFRSHMKIGGSPQILAAVAGVETLGGSVSFAYTIPEDPIGMNRWPPGSVRRGLAQGRLATAKFRPDRRRG